MLTGKESVYPQIDTDVEFADVNNEKQYGRTYNHTEGINLRQHYAGLAMQGILNSIPLKLQDMEALLKYYAKQYPGMSMFECVAAEAVGQADALIEALNK